MKSISIVIPCYNEEATIKQAIEKTMNFLAKNNLDFEIIIVNDASTDKTRDIIDEFASDKITILNNEINLGKGYSVKRGVLAAIKDYILFLDADFSTPIEELIKFEPYHNNHKIIIGSRRIENNLIKIPQPFWKRNLGIIGNRLIKKINQLPFEDTQCGFKLLHHDCQQLFKKMTINRWGFDIELLHLAQKHKFPVYEVGVNWFNNFDTKVKLKDYLRTFCEIIKIRLNDWQGKYD